MSRIPIEDLTQLSALIQVRSKMLAFTAKFMSNEVNKHEITTNHGQKRRTIYAPTPKLKMMQTRIREQLILPLPLPDHVHGFVPGKSLVTNASAHVDSGLIINIDLKNFFPNIKSGRVYSFWQWLVQAPLDRSQMTKDQKKLVWVLAQLTSFDGHLCQGFVTSPDIANHVAWKLDRRVSALATQNGFRYTRYADDLTFSTKAYDGNCEWLIKAVREIAAEEGFTVNEKKIAIMRGHRRQTVTGLIVNRDARTKEPLPPRISRYDIRRIRAICDKGAGTRSPEDQSYVEGWIAYIESVKPELAQKLKAVREQRMAKPKWSQSESLAQAKTNADRRSERERQEQEKSADITQK